MLALPFLARQELFAGVPDSLQPAPGGNVDAPAFVGDVPGATGGVNIFVVDVNICAGGVNNSAVDVPDRSGGVNACAGDIHGNIVDVPDVTVDLHKRTGGRSLLLVGRKRHGKLQPDKAVLDYECGAYLEAAMIPSNMRYAASYIIE